MTERKTPTRSSRSQRLPADPESLASLLREMNIDPPSRPQFELVSKWAAKHVWKVVVDGKPWAFIRYLLGSASRYPDRWRHMRLGQELYDAHVGPRILGLTSESDSLGGRAAVVEAALAPISRESLESRPSDAISLFSRLHGCGPLHEALSEDLTEADLSGFSPIGNLFQETKERWFDAVTGRWLEAGIRQINAATDVISELIRELEVTDNDTERISIVVPAHNDPNHGNFMINRSGMLRMIDFEGLALSNPVADLGIFLTWYVDQDKHRDVLAHYPLAEPDAVMERMRVWVPLRYLNIAAHWAGRLSRSEDLSSWEFAANSVDEWLRGAAELIFDSEIPDPLHQQIDSLTSGLLNNPIYHNRDGRHGSQAEPDDE